jgi:hypothetical protein
VAAELGGQARPGSKILADNIKETVAVKQMLTSFIKKLKADAES